MGQRGVLIISDSTDFTGMLKARWQGQREIPEFTVLRATFWDHSRVLGGDVAVVAPLPRSRLEPVLRSLCDAGIPAMCIAEDAEALAWVCALYPRMTVIRLEVWEDSAVTLCREVLARVASQERALQAERLAAANQHFATLGRYVVETRHSFNNAMTSLLGNAELLLMEAGAFTPRVRQQLSTIRVMAMRMNQMMLRLTSLETEMEIVEGYAAESIPSMPERKLGT